MTLLFCTITFIYVVLIACFIYGFNNVSHFTSKDIQDITCFSIIIPFRNEADNLPKLLESLKALHYDINLFEILFIDDHSSDASKTIITSSLEASGLNFKILKNIQLSKAPKKDAITKAIQHAKHPWIVTTDADCQIPKKWLHIFNQAIKRTDANMLVAPVAYTHNTSFLHNFQVLDFLSLQSTTIGGFGLNRPFLCNGANLVYKKQAFLDVKGFQLNNTIASGDDIFLMESLLQKESGKVVYIKSKEAIVTTAPENSWIALYNQRLRWASKTANYSQLFPKVVGLIVLLMNSAFIAMFLLQLTNLLNNYYFFGLIVLKIIIDFYAIFKAAHFLNVKKALDWYMLSAIAHPFFIVCVVINSQFFKYKWKGRNFSA